MKTTPLSAELGKAEFGDPRRAERLAGMADALAERPGESLPKAMGSEAALEGAYRFLRNPHVTPERILDPHVQATVARAEASGRVVLAVSDTTEFVFTGQADRGVGIGMTRKRQGFLGHFCLAVTGDGARRPLGLLGFRPVFRTGNKPIRDTWTRKRDPARESVRWIEVALDVANRTAGMPLIHVMDREADNFELMSALIAAKQRFVIRIAQNRALLKDGARVKLFDELRRVPTLALREVPLSPRAAKTKRRRRRPPYQFNKHPPRGARMAELELGAGSFTIARAKWSSDPELPDCLSLNCVRVHEPRPPEGEQPVEWMLITTEPIDTVAEILAVVDSYRARWVIEEYFKALKTGCAFEKNQLESRHTILNYLAVLAPVAWQLLLLRSLARNTPSSPAESALSRVQIEVLKAVAKKPLPPEPTVEEAFLAVAALGGHLKHNGPPGWQTLGKGFHDLLLYEAGWRAHASQSPPGSDQS